MRNTRRSVLAAMAALLLFASLASAAVKDYQVTGPVLEVGSDKIVVQKGKDRWEIARDASTKMGDVKVGDKVTIHYRMTATDVEGKSKPAKAESKSSKKK
jgi:hypothetical protein